MNHHTWEEYSHCFHVICIDLMNLLETKYRAADHAVNLILKSDRAIHAKSLLTHVAHA